MFVHPRNTKVKTLLPLKPDPPQGGKVETASMGGSLLSHPSQCAKAVIFLVLILLCRCEDRAAELSPNSALVRGAADAGDPDASAEGPSLPGLEPAEGSPVLPAIAHGA